jgi:small subunit ribosomal protein S19
MSRSKWKGVFLCYSLYKKYLYLKKANINTFIQIYNRSSTILNEFVGAHFKVYNGLRFLNVFVTENKVGYKFGEFSYTRKLRKCIHIKSNVKKRNLKKK